MIEIELDLQSFMQLIITSCHFFAYTKKTRLEDANLDISLKKNFKILKEKKNTVSLNFKNIHLIISTSSLENSCSFS